MICLFYSIVFSLFSVTSLFLTQTHICTSIFVKTFTYTIPNNLP